MPFVDGLARRSREHAYALAQCPKCGSTDIRGPYDGKRNAWFVFSRTWFCRACWWERQIEIFDDLANAKDRHEKAEKRRRERAYR